MPTFDYIIIGAGSAGCVLANRLSAHPGNKVLLLEAGGPDNDRRIRVPGGYPDLHYSRHNWKFRSEPQEYLKNRKLFLPRGKTLGGCSSINAMAYVRGNPTDFDKWKELGNDGWSYADLLPYFIKSVTNEDFDQLNPSYHGEKGELHVSYAKRFQTPFADAFIEAGVQTGMKRNDDCNGAFQEGIGRFQFTIKNGKRYSAADAFLKPILRRGNLHVITKAHVTRVICSKDVAKGVEYATEKGDLQSVDCRKEIILSAGSYQSPQILMLSGIGDRDYLKHMHIECNHYLAGVGQNLQDHLFWSVAAESRQQLGINHFLRNRELIKAFIQYSLFKSGPLTIGPLEAVAFFHLDDFRKTANFQFHFTPFHIGRGYKYDIYDKKTYPTWDGFTICPTLVHPDSRGWVRLRTNNPLDPPIIQPNFLEKESDLEQCLKGTKIALQLIRQTAFDPYRKEIITPASRNSDDVLIDHIRKSAEAIYHPVGTCKMGHDEMSVVNDHLQVHGIGKLWVVDASIMPRIVTGNTNAAVYCIAEKAADMIINQ